MIPIPKIALVGRPNVGKSTLFNRICGRRKAITDGRPGSTRDRNYAQTSWQGAAFELIDTGGLLLGTDDPLLGPAAVQADLAIEEADLVLFVVDGRAGLLPDDRAIAKSLRKKGKRVLVAVNKLEKDQDALEEFARSRRRRPAGRGARRAAEGGGPRGGRAAHPPRDRGAAERRQVVAAQPLPRRGAGGRLADPRDDP
jgi:small GTP-binding protein